MLPDPLFVFLEGGSQTKIVGALRVTRKPIVVYDKEMYRDSPPVVTGGAYAASNDITDSQTISGSIAGGIDPTITLGVTPSTLQIVGSASTEQDDSYTHIPKRYVPKLDTLIQFWDALTPGQAMTISVTTVSGNATVTVSDATLLTPGQGITGAGIPAGTTILNFITQAAGVISTTAVVLSQQAIATATVEATLTGGNLLGEVMQSEFISWGSENSYPI